MKRKGNLYKDICSIDNLYKEYYKIRVRCRNKRAVGLFDRYYSLYIYRILEGLCKKNYEFSNYHIFIISEPKYRLIMSECISDKIVNHAVSSYILLPALEHKLIYSNVATRKNKGSGLANDLIYKYLNILNLKNKKIYVLKIDIKKYFYNINHEILFEMIKKDIKDKDALRIIKIILDSTDDSYVNEEINKVRNNKICSIRKLNISSEEKIKKIDELKKLPVYKKGKGLGIGNMTSQILAIYYLNGIDHFIKEDLRVKYYIRYMDDLVFLDTDYKRLKKIFDMVKVKIENLDLELNDKSRILDFDRGFSFLGYTYKNCNGLIIRINNFTYRRVRRHLRNLKRFDGEMYERSLISYKGFFFRSNVFKRVLG